MPRHLNTAVSTAKVAASAQVAAAVTEVTTASHSGCVARSSDGSTGETGAVVSSRGEGWPGVVCCRVGRYCCCDTLQHDGYGAYKVECPAAADWTDKSETTSCIVITGATATGMIRIKAKVTAACSKLTWAGVSDDFVIWRQR